MLDSPKSPPHVREVVSIAITDHAPVIRTIPKLDLFQIGRAAGSVSYPFEELSIEVSGAHVGFFNGTAEVHYFKEDGQLEWFVDEIRLHCTKHENTVQLDRTDWLFTQIWDVLTNGSFKDFVDAAVERDI